MIILGLDISSTNIGAAVWNTTRDGVFDTISIKLKGDLPARLREGSLSLLALLDEYSPDVVAFEDAAYRANAMALIAQQRMVGCLFAALAYRELTLPVVGIAPATAKKR